MKDNKLVIRLKDGQVTLNAETPLGFEDFMTIFCSVALSSMRKLVDNAPDDAKETVRNMAYDAFNLSVSKVLELFAPEFELRPNLTALAIKEAEDKIIMEGRLGEVEPGT